MNPQQLAQQFIDALHALEQGSEEQVEALVALFATDARLTNAALQLAGREEKGADGARHFWTQYRRTLGRAYSRFSHVTTDEKSAGLFWTTEGQTQDGVDISYDGVSLLEFGDDGKITFFRGYYDTRDLTIETSAIG